MVDTITIRFQLTSVEYDNTFSRILGYTRKKSNKHQPRNKGYGYVTNAFAEFGFQEVKMIQGDYGYRAIEVLLRPKLLINPKGYYKLSTVSEFDEISKAFNKIIYDKLDLNVTELGNWKAKRIDPAVDVKVEEDLIHLYLKLFKRGNIPDYFTEKFPEDENNLYLVSKNFTLNWYDRYPTIKDKALKKREQNKSKKEYNDFSETRGTLRLETQNKKCNQSVNNMMNEDKLKKEVMKFYNLIVGEGDYYSMDEATKIIHSYVKNLSKRIDLKRTLELIEKCGSVSKARKYYMKGKDGNTASEKFNKRINQLRKLGINPVVLPNEWEISKLENLYKKIEVSFKSK